MKASQLALDEVCLSYLAAPKGMLRKEKGWGGAEGIKYPAVDILL